MLRDAGFDATAGKLTEAIRLEVFEPPLTLEDHEAMLVALGESCPAGLARLRRELLDEQRWRRRMGL